MRENITLCLRLVSVLFLVAHSNQFPNWFEWSNKINTGFPILYYNSSFLFEQYEMFCGLKYNTHHGYVFVCVTSSCLLFKMSQ